MLLAGPPMFVADCDEGEGGGSRRIPQRAIVGQKHGVAGRPVDTLARFPTMVQLQTPWLESEIGEFRGESHTKPKIDP